MDNGWTCGQRLEQVPELFARKVNGPPAAAVLVGVDRIGGQYGPGKLCYLSLLIRVTRQ